MGLDRASIPYVYFCYDWGGAETTQTAVEANPGRTCQVDRCPQKHGCPLGARGTRDEGDDRQAD
jgi:hypothetical protein